MKKLFQTLFKIQAFCMGSGEMLLIRAALAYLIWTQLFFGIAQATQTMPVGLAHFMDLSFLQNSATYESLRWGLAVALVAWMAGLCTPLATTYILFLISAVGSLRNSYGNIHHGTQIVGMVMLGYTAGYFWKTFQTRQARGMGQRFLWADRQMHETASWWALQAAVAAYVIAGISKLDNSGWGWITGLVNLPLHVEKIGFQHYLSSGQLEPFEHSKDMAGMLAMYPNLTLWVVGSGLFFELFAFWALFSRWHASIFGVILFVMHLQIVWLMQLDFPLNSWVLALLFVNFPFYLMWLLRKLGIYDDRPQKEEDLPSVAA
jgi:hypothetical protein